MFSKLKLASSEEKKQKIIAHRGMSGKYPENTILAFEAARLLGLRWIETDINMIGDETLVVFHDKSFGRTVSGNCLTKNVSWKDFKDLDAGLWKGEGFAGQKVMRLGELITWAETNNMMLILEMKIYDSRKRRAAEVLTSALRNCKKANIIISSFDIDFLRHFKRFCKNIPIASIHTSLPENIDSLITELDIEAVHLDHHLLRKSTDVLSFRAKGIKVRAWTANDPFIVEHLFALGVDMVMSDYPELI
jgi:glycerophosphoryl diester phosphodiesterase